MNRRREVLIIAVLLTSLLLITVLSAVQQARQLHTSEKLDSDSTAPAGARALSLWLTSLGFKVNSAVPDPVFAIPEGTALVFILEPIFSITEEEWQVLDAWVRQGGTLILVGDGFWTARAMQHYDARLLYRDMVLSPASPPAPLWTNPPGATTIETRTYAHVDVARQDVVPLLMADAAHLLVTFPQGQGRVILGTTSFPFSNAGLRRPGNPELVLNLLSDVPRSGGVWFDEWHHGRRSRVAPSQGPLDWLRFTPAGRAVFYAAAIIFLGLVLQGRSFGRPVPLPRAMQRRRVLEHITALAHLSRRAGHRLPELRYYHTTLKRRLGRRYRLDPALPDAIYVEQLAAYEPQLDAEALLALLTQMQRAVVDEVTLVRLTREAAQWMAD